MRARYMAAALALSFVTAACGDSDPSGPGDLAGSYEIEISGAVEESFEGPAWFGADENEEGDPVFAMVFGNDDSRHALVVGKLGTSRPDVGTYDISDEEGGWNLVHFVTDDDTIVGMFLGIEGTVQITHSSNSSIRGTITFAATGYLGQEEADIEGTVTFEARPVPMNASVASVR